MVEIRPTERAEGREQNAVAYESFGKASSDRWMLNCQYLLDVLDQQGFSETDLSEEDESAIKGIRDLLSTQSIQPCHNPKGDKQLSKLGTHTLGPWVVNDTNGAVESEKEHGLVNDGWIICEGYGPDADANTKLISAAPELLGALKDLVGESTETFAHWPDLKAQALSAIAKAEGL